MILVDKDFWPDRNPLEYPLIIKPVDDGGCYGVYLCRNDDQYLEAKQKSLQNLYKSDGSHSS